MMSALGGGSPKSRRSKGGYVNFINRLQNADKGVKHIIYIRHPQVKLLSINCLNVLH